MREAMLPQPSTFRGLGSGQAFSIWLRYGVPILSVVLAWLVRMALDPWLGNVQAFSFFYAVVALTAWWAGWRPAVLALVLGYLAGHWFFLPPRHALRLENFADVMELVTYFSVGGTIILLSTLLRQAEAQARGSTRAVLQEKRELEAEIAERKRAEAALRQSEQRFRAIFDQAPIAIALHALDGHFFQVNSVACSLFGRSGGDLCHLTIQDVVYREDWSLTSDRLPQLLAGKIPHYAIERRYVRADGSLFWGRADVSLVRDAAGEPSYVIGALVDVSERKRAEAILARDRKELEQLVRERTLRLQETIGDLEHFSYSITHDMRAPLRAMHSYATLLEEECKGCLRPEALEFFQRIKAASGRMDELIKDSLEYARLAREELALTRVDPSKVLHRIMEHDPNLPADKVEVQIEGKLPCVVGNEAALAHCLANLLGNAVKFVPAGVKPRVRVWAEQVQGLVRLWVEDNGIGIPKEAQEKIFGMFQRLHRDDEYPGTGIGLAIVRKAVHRMGGEVGVESEVGKGSKFWIELARAR